MIRITFSRIARCAAATLATLTLLTTPVYADDRSKTVTVAVIAINDFHASFLPYPDQDIPGAANLFFCVDSLRKQYPYHIVVSAGDNFGGSFFSRKTDDKYMPWLFDKLGINLSVVGNHEFDNGQAFLADRWESVKTKPEGWHLTYVAANVTDTRGNIPSYFTPVSLQEVQVGGTRPVRIAFAGLVTATTPQQAAAKHLVGLNFDGRYAQVLARLNENRPLKARLDSADIRIIATHVGTDMQQGVPVWTIPSDTVEFIGVDTLGYHAILSAHSHNPVSGVINGLPVIQAECYGKHVGLLRFEVDTVSGEVRTLTPQLCPVSYTKEKNAQKEEIEMTLKHILDTTKNETGRPLGQTLTRATAFLEHNRNHKEVISPLGSMICASFADAARKSLKLSAPTPVVGMCHTAGIRNSIGQGEVRVIDAGQVLPFANKVAVFRMTGRELKGLLQFGLNNKRFGWLQSHSLTLETKKKDGRYVLLKAVYKNPVTGKKTLIKDLHYYYVAADDFMTHGGDDYPEVYFKDNRLKAEMPYTSEAFFRYLSKQAAIYPEMAPHTKVIVK